MEGALYTRTHPLNPPTFKYILCTHLLKCLNQRTVLITKLPWIQSLDSELRLRVQSNPGHIRVEFSSPRLAYKIGVCRGAETKLYYYSFLNYVKLYDRVRRPRRPSERKFMPRKAPPGVECRCANYDVRIATRNADVEPKSRKCFNWLLQPRQRCSLFLFVAFPAHRLDFSLEGRTKTRIRCDNYVEWRVAFKLVRRKCHPLVPPPIYRYHSTRFFHFLYRLTPYLHLKRTL